MFKSINQWAFPQGMTAIEMLHTAKELGYEAFEPAVGLDGVLTVDTPDSEFIALREEAAKIGMRLSSLAGNASWRESPTANDPAVREKAYRNTVRQLQCAKLLGVDAILYVPGLVTGGGDAVNWQDAWERAVQQLKRLAPVAEECGVVIGVENVWNNLLLSPRDMTGMLDAVDSPWVQCYLDVGNIIKFGWPEMWIPMLKGRIVRVHIKDYNRADGTLAGFCPLLTGDVDYPAVLRELEKAGYDLDIIAEVANGMESLVHTSEAMDRILGR